jgi:hypothetical protein
MSREADHDDALDRLIHEVDLDGLVRLVDARCASGDWAGLLRLRDRCAAATRESGRQLWPAATLAEYRLALLAPPNWAATVLDGEAGRFTIGPLSDVVAVHHTWAEMAPHLEPVPVATFVAHERSIRGERIGPAALERLPLVLDIPVEIQVWEPSYPQSTYSDAGADHPQPHMTPPSTPAKANPGGSLVDDAATELAVRHLVEPWTSASTGRAEVVCVEGTVLHALGALGARDVRTVELTAGEGLAWLAWSGASGGAHGRRRGMAHGRFAMWWVLGALGDLQDEWPPTNHEIESLLADLRWYRWDAHEPPGGWRLQLAIEDQTEGLAWAINAVDG